MAAKIEDINTSEKLEEYLEDQPKELAQTMAFRWAMRVLPLINVSFSRNFSDRYLLTQTVFRGSLISWSACKWQDRDLTSAAYLVTRKIRASSIDVVDNKASTETGFDQHIPAEVAKVLLGVARAISSIDGAIFVINDVVRASANVFFGAVNSADETFSTDGIVWNIIQQDLMLFEKEGVNNLTNSPLWHGDIPTIIQKHWNSLKGTLLAQDPNWYVWTDWYEHILQGANSPKRGIAALSDKTLIQLAQKPNEFWDREPDVVNTEIVGWLEEEESVDQPSLTMVEFILQILEELKRPVTIDEFVTAFEQANYKSPRHSIRARLNELTEKGIIERVAEATYALHEIEALNPEDINEPEKQSQSAVMFVDGGDDPINVDFNASVSKLLLDKSASDRHSEVLRCADRMIGSYDPSERGANSVTVLIDEVKHFRDALGSSIADANPDFLIPRGDGLRQYLEAQDNRDDFSGLPEILDKYLLGLKSIISSYNIYVSLDPYLANRDEARLGPDTVKTLISPLHGQEIIKRATDVGVASEDVGSVLAEEAKVSPVEPDTANRNSRRYSESIKNFARVLLAKGLSSVKYLWKHKGKVDPMYGAIKAISKLLIDYEDVLLELFADHPIMLNVIKQIIGILKKVNPPS